MKVMHQAALGLTDLSRLEWRHGFPQAAGRTGKASVSAHHRVPSGDALGLLQVGGNEASGTRPMSSEGQEYEVCGLRDSPEEGFQMGMCFGVGSD